MPDAIAAVVRLRARIENLPSSARCELAMAADVRAAPSADGDWLAPSATQSKRAYRACWCASIRAEEVVRA